MIESPICLLNTCDKNGFFIPPPNIISSANYNIFFTNFNLSDTFAPPNIAKTGLLGFYKKLPKKLSYFSINKPATLNLWLIPTTLLCALCAVPNASLTKQLPNCDNCDLNYLIFYGSAFIFVPSDFLALPVSSKWKRTF